MSSHLSRHFEQARLARNLKPSELARLAGCVNIHKNASKIRQFELTGNISPELFAKIAAVLEIDAATIEKLVKQDRRGFFEKWMTWANEPIQPYLVERLIAAVYRRVPVPSEITTMVEAESWAAAVALERRRKCCLVWSRRISVWIAEDGTVYSRTEAAPGEPNMPWMKVGGKKVLFGEGLRTVVDE
jgi:transcriptional regulator with XRE-family HTH domain